MNLELQRPLAFFDIESTGTNRQRDRIIDLAVIKLMPDGSRETHEWRVNPGFPIPPESTAIHGITDADVAKAPFFGEIAREVADALEGCDLAGFNSIHFDVPLLIEEFRRANVAFTDEGRSLVDAQRIYHRKEPRDLSAALRFYCEGATHDGAHSALDDVDATLRVLEGQLERYPDLPRSVEALGEFCNPRDPWKVDREGRFRWNAENEAVIAFGPHQGRTLKDLAINDRGFLEWMLRKDFPGDTMELVREALEGRYPRRS